MKETRAYDKLKTYHPTAHWQRIETWTGTGIWDVNAIKAGKEIWVECKQVKAPKRHTTLIKPKVEQAQVVWGFQRRLAGGKTYIAIMVGSELYVIPGIWLKDLKAGIPFAVLKVLNINPEDLFV